MVRFFALILAMAAIYFIRDTLFALIFAVIIASAMEPAIEWLRR
mgnify:CR=1 FL=1